MPEIDDWVSPEAASPPGNYQKALNEKYPWTSGIGLHVVDSTGKGDPSRKLEFYRADERDNPHPGKPTIEVFDKAMSEKDLMGEVLSHHLPQVDPAVADFRNKIIRSMTPEQIAEIQGDFDNEKKAGLVDQGDDLKAWLQKQGGDSFFRGYPTGQWPEAVYTPEQKSTYGQLNSYLESKYGRPQPKGLINMPSAAP